jgi:hypothetical protein
MKRFFGLAVGLVAFFAVQSVNAQECRDGSCLRQIVEAPIKAVVHVLDAVTPDYRIGCRVDTACVCETPVVAPVATPVCEEKPANCCAPRHRIVRVFRRCR